MRGKVMNILLVDDDPGDRQLVTLALKQASSKFEVEVSTANTLADGLDHLKGGNIDLVLLDLGLPDSQGLETADRVCRVYPHIPVVVLTTSKEESDVVASFDYGAAGYMVKPVDYKRFLETIDVINRYWTLSKLPDGE